MNRKKIFRIISVFVFLLLFIIVYQKIERTLALKSGSSRIYNFYHKEKRNSYDVIFLGSIHAYYGSHPMEIWKEFGVTSYVLASPLQDIGSTYYLMKDAIRLQHPKVIAVEGFSLSHVEKIREVGMCQVAMDGMPLSLNKIQMGMDMLKDQFSFEDQLTFYLPIMQYHSRWSELKPGDFETKPDITKGGKPIFSTRRLSVPPIITDKKEIPENSLYYIEKMIKLCQENDVGLVFYKTPFVGIRKGKYPYKTRQGVYNSLEEYLQDRDIPFINYASLVDEIEINFKTDFKDKGHLNLNGGKKVNKHLMQFLCEKYSLEDHRGNKGYASWNNDLETYEKELEVLRNNTAKADNDDEEVQD